MSRKSKGIGFERELIHLFWANSWCAVRVAGSGSSKYPSPDVLAGNNLRKIAIECKNTSEKAVYIPKREINELVKFSKLFGAEPWVAVKFGKEKIYFITIEDMKETNSSYSASNELSKQKGLLFDELIKY